MILPLFWRIFLLLFVDIKKDKKVMSLDRKLILVYYSTIDAKIFRLRARINILYNLCLHAYI